MPDNAVLEQASLVQPEVLDSLLHNLPALNYSLILPSVSAMLPRSARILINLGKKPFNGVDVFVAVTKIRFGLRF
jgi:hypothetical protein